MSRYYVGMVIERVWDGVVSVPIPSFFVQNNFYLVPLKKLNKMWWDEVNQV